MKVTKRTVTIPGTELALNYTEFLPAAYEQSG